MAQGPQQQPGTHEIWVALAVLPLISCNLQQVFLLLHAFVCFLICCCQLQIIKGKEKKGKEVVALFLPVCWALPRVVRGWTRWQRRNLTSYPATSHFLTFRSHLICSVHLRTVSFWGQRCSLIWSSAAPNTVSISTSRGSSKS